MRYADELAKRGFVCLVPEYPTYGSSAFDLKKQGATYASGAIKAVWDNIRGIDLLETMPQVNAKRIGIIGHGLGGQNALLTAALDYRLAAVVSSCGFTTLPRYKGGNLTDWAKPGMMPRIGDVYKNDPSKIPFDFAELLGTLVPRSVFVIAPLRDDVMDVEGVKSAVASAATVYQFRKTANALKLTHPDSGRDFTAAARTEAYAWLEQRLKR
jgi:dienelactone hydrolase